MKVIIDMNLSPLWEGFLLENDIEAIHWSRIGNAWAPDQEIFEYAFKNDCIIFTNDLDFGTILAQSKARLPSIIQLRTLEISIETMGQTLVKCIKENKEYFSEGALMTIETDRLRIRSLPIQ
jgi:predicted nuclease of predicted toxin-antitoxin system